MLRSGIIAGLVLAVGVGVAAAQRPIREATLQDGTGKEVGRVRMELRSGEIVVEVRARGVAAGTHGLHLHEVGLCEGPSFETAGGHFNPGNKEHGRQNPRGSHLGDLGNITVAGNGSGDRVVTITSAEARRGIENFLGEKGRAIVIHANEDDDKTDPTGNAGARVACAAVMP